MNAAAADKTENAARKYITTLVRSINPLPPDEKTPVSIISQIICTVSP